MPLIREALAAGQSVTISPMGRSMLPMLRQEIDTVTLSPLPARMHKYDLPLYRRDNGKYVLHRIIAVEETYTCMGDNQLVPEPGLRHDQMIALVTSFSRNGRKILVTALSYRIYCRVWIALIPLRRFFQRFKRVLRSVLK